MKHKAAITAVLALTMATGQLAIAQGNSNHDRGDNDRRQQDRRMASNHHDNRDFGRRHEEERSRGGRGAGPFFFNDTATTEIYTLSQHDYLAI